MLSSPSLFSSWYMEIPGKVLGTPGAGDEGCVGLAVVAGLPSAVAGVSAECGDAAL